MPSPASRPWRRRGLVAAGLVLVAALVATGLVLLLNAPGNVSHPNVEFTTPAPAPPKRRPVHVDTFVWPFYGLDAARNRFFPSSRVHPPFRIGWHFQDFALIEFPPVIYHGRLFLLDDDGSAKELDARTGQKLWETKVGTLAAASPAIGEKQRLIFLALLSTNADAQRTSRPGNGRFVALSMSTGKLVWSMPIPPGSESSPVTWNDSVYFGSQDGTVYSVRARDGHVNWTYHAQGAVKGGLAEDGGILFFGDYAGRAYALDARSGRVVWAVNTSGADYGLGSGNFYSTPAVAFGRVFIGNTDHRVYSFAEHTGQLAWVTGTGNYVYASPAVANVPGLGPTVYIGSYDANFYALDARSGAIRWRHASGGRISGSATIVGNVVFYSDLGVRTTSGLDLRTGRRVFFFRDGVFNPVVADPRTIYLAGYSILYELVPSRS